MTLTILSPPLFIIFGDTPGASELLLLVLVGAPGNLGYLCMTTASSMADATAVMSLDFFASAVDSANRYCLLCRDCRRNDFAWRCGDFFKQPLHHLSRVAD